MVCAVGDTITVGRRAMGGGPAALVQLLLLLLAHAVDGLAVKATAAPARLQGERHAVSGPHVAIYNLAGEVQVEPGAGREVEVFINTSGPDAEELHIEKGPVRGLETLRIVYPSNRVVYRASSGSSDATLNVNKDGTFGGGPTVKICGSGSGLEAHANLRITVPHGQMIDVHLGSGRVNVSNVNAQLRVDVARADITCSHTTGGLRLESAIGSITVKNAAGDIRLDVAAGPVQVANVRGGTLRADIGMGSIEGDDIRVDVLHMDTGSGSIDVGGLTARRVRLDSGSGSVRAALDSDVDNLTMDTGSGDVTLYVPSTFGAELSAEPIRGSFNTRIPVDAMRKSRDKILGRIGDGRGKASLGTASGSILLALNERQR